MNKYGFNFDNSYENLPSRFYQKINLDPVSKPRLLVFNDSLAQELGLKPESFKSEEGVSILSASTLPEGASSIAQAYMGHQFGYPNLLGDGRALLMGEQITPKGQRYDLQFKGSGPTPYSRSGDGRAVLSPMLREYIISEAMNGLNIPTTRSLSVVETGDKVMRYQPEKGAILVRIAKSHLRVGTFEFARGTEDIKLLKSLADYAIDRHFPHLKNASNPYLSFFGQVIEDQARLIAQWMLVGFVHGVMNTDNVSIAGETIDYGPCAFMDTYDPKTVFSSIDQGGRYAYGNQPKIGAWNLSKFGQSLLPLLDKNEVKAVDKANEELEKYLEVFQKTYYGGLGNKLGLKTQHKEDQKYISLFLDFLKNNNLDYTNTFLDLTFNHLEDESYQKEDFQNWKTWWDKRLLEEDFSQEKLETYMKRQNPAIIPRNHWVELALREATEGSYELFFDLLKNLQNPFSHALSQKKYQDVPKDVPYITFCGT